MLGFRRLYSSSIVVIVSVALAVLVVGLGEGFGVGSISQSRQPNLTFDAFNVLQPGMTETQVAEALWPANMVKYQGDYLTWIYIVPDGLDFAYVTLYYDKESRKLVNATTQRNESSPSGIDASRARAIRSLPYS